MCNNLPFSAKTLTDVAEPLESFYAGESALPDDLNPSLRLLVNFFDEHALSLGYQLNKKPRSTVLPVPLDKVVPLDRVLYRLSSMANKGVTVRQSPAGYRPLTTGLRIHELAAASYGDIECLEDESGEHYFLQVIGKQNKMRKTSLPLMFVR